MDSAEFLDLLGNENRRRILRLLSQKPCYVTEISEYIGVSPKAVIDHLRQLEEAGLVESRTDTRRRKYFSISRHVRLEVTVSPYEFGTRSAYPSNSRFDVTSCQRVNIQLDALTPPEADATPVESTPSGETPTADGSGESVTDSPQGVTGNSPEMTGPSPSSDATLDTRMMAGTTPTLARRLRDLKDLERELSLIHRWTEGRIVALRERIADQVEVGDPRLVSELLVTLADDPQEMETLCRRLGVSPAVLEELLDVLEADGVVQRDGRYWKLVK